MCMHMFSGEILNESVQFIVTECIYDANKSTVSTDTVYGTYMKRTSSSIYHAMWDVEFCNVFYSISFHIYSILSWYQHKQYRDEHGTSLCTGNSILHEDL